MENKESIIISSVIAKVAKIEPQQVNLDSQLSQWGIDETKVLKILAKLEDIFPPSLLAPYARNLPSMTFSNLKTVRDVQNFVLKQHKISLAA